MGIPYLLHIYLRTTCLSSIQVAPFYILTFLKCYCFDKSQSTFLAAGRSVTLRDLILPPNVFWASRISMFFVVKVKIYAH
jgi:hypothetical protein